MNSQAPVDEDFDSTRTGNLAAAGLKPGAVLAQRFRIERLLGIGGMGMVYAATDLDLDIPVAIKLLRPELALRGASFERIRQELLIARQVSSPHVVRIHDLARDGDRAFITMDLIEGEPLDRRLERVGMLGIDEAVELAIQVAEGLKAAHACNVVHRDLKPSNVLVDTRGRALIADFGVARSLATGSVRSHSGAIVGTPEYLSPEQARGLPVDGRSDLYTLGLLLFEMLTGRLPFEAATPAEAISQRLLAVPKPLRQVRPEAPQWLEQLLARLLRTQPAHRIGDAETVIRALKDKRAPFDPGLLRRIVLRALLVLLLTAGAGVAMWRWPFSPAPPVPAIAAPAARLLLLADADGQAAGRDVLDGQVEVLRRLLDGQARWPVIDAERAHQAVAQLSLPEGAAPSATVLWSQLPGVHILRLRAGANGGPAQLEWQLPDGSPVRTLAQTTDGAALLRATMAALGHPNAPPGSPQWPTDLEPGTLADFGRAVREAAGGRPSEAAAILDRALTGRSDGTGRALLALERAQLAIRSGESAQAAALLAAIQPTLPASLAAAAADLQIQTGAADDASLAVLAGRAERSADDLWIRLAQARASGEGGDHAGALEQLRQLCEQDPGEPRAWFLRGKYAILRGDARPAVDEYLVRALVLYKRARHDYGEAETVNALGVGYARLGQLDDAAEQYERAVTLRRQLGNRRGEASSLRNLAQLATVRGETTRAAELLARARSLFEQLGDAAGQAAIDNELGLLAEERGDYTRALADYRRALRARERLDDRQATAETLNNIGYAHHQLGDYDSAQVYWRQAAEAFVKLDDLSGRVRTGQNLGLLETARGQFQEARQQLEQSLVLAEQQQMAEETAVSLRNLAELALLEGRLADAQQHLTRTRTLFETRGDQRGLIAVTVLEVQLKMASGRWPEARAQVLAWSSGQLEEASLEQRALVALLRAVLGSNAAEIADARREAGQLAAASGVRVLVLSARMLDSALQEDATLDADIEALGNVPLQLQWLEQQLAAAVASDRADRGPALYRRARALLASVPGYGRAWALHALGQQTLAAAGQDDDAARKAARESARALIVQLPPEVDPDWLRRLQDLAHD